MYSIKYKRYIGHYNKETGYITISPHNKSYKHKGVHQYIFMIGNQCDIPDGYDVHHINGNRTDNRLCNLELIEHSKHISEHTLGVNKSVEMRKKLSITNTGRKHTEETKRKVSESLYIHYKLNPISDETKKKMSESHIGKTANNKGIHHTEETKEKMSKSHMGKSSGMKGKYNNPNTSKKVAKFSLDDEFIQEYNSIMEASREGFNPAHISGCCLGKIKQHKGFKWKHIQKI